MSSVTRVADTRLVLLVTCSLKTPSRHAEDPWNSPAAARDTSSGADGVLTDDTLGMTMMELQEVAWSKATVLAPGTAAQAPDGVATSPPWHQLQPPSALPPGPTRAQATHTSPDSSAAVAEQHLPLLHVPEAHSPSSVHWAPAGATHTPPTSDPATPVKGSTSHAEQVALVAGQAAHRGAPQHRPWAQLRPGPQSASRRQEPGGTQPPLESSRRPVLHSEQVPVNTPRAEPAQAWHWGLLVAQQTLRLQGPEAQSLLPTHTLPPLPLHVPLTNTRGGNATPPAPPAPGGDPHAVQAPVEGAQALHAGWVPTAQHRPPRQAPPGHWAPPSGLFALHTAPGPSSRVQFPLGVSAYPGAQ